MNDISQSAAAACGRTALQALPKEKALGLALKEKPQLVMDASVKGGPVVYRCSACGQILLPPKDRPPKDAATELWATFKQHLQEKHSDEAAG